MIGVPVAMSCGDVVEGLTARGLMWLLDSMLGYGEMLGDRDNSEESKLGKRLRFGDKLELGEEKSMVGEEKAMVGEVKAMVGS
jgi:hypothetical protein